MGKTEGSADALTDRGGNYRGNIAGCYVHGIFDSAAVSGSMIQALYQAKGLPYQGERLDRRAHREAQLDLLADTVRQNLNIARIYQIMEDGV